MKTLGITPLDLQAQKSAADESQPDEESATV
jgi:hypothetical protein